MTVEQLINELLTVFNNLKNNEQFINCYQDKEKVKDILNQYIEELEYDKGLYEDDSIRISVYSTGLLQKVVKVDVEMQEDNQAIAIIEVAKKDEENFEFKIKVEDQTILGTIQATKKDKNFVTGSIKIDIPEFGKVILNIDVNNKFDTTIDAVDTNNVIKENEITQEDAMEILEKFQDSKLYEIVNETSGGMLDIFFNSSNNPSDRGLVFEEEEVLLNDYEEYVNSLT